MGWSVYRRGHGEDEGVGARIGNCQNDKCLQTWKGVTLFVRKEILKLVQSRVPYRSCAHVSVAMHFLTLLLSLTTSSPEINTRQQLLHCPLQPQCSEPPAEVNTTVPPSHGQCPKGAGRKGLCGEDTLQQVCGFVKNSFHNAYCGYIPPQWQV